VSCFICNSSKMTGLAELPHGSHLVVAPFATAARNDGPTGDLGWRSMANQPDGNVARNSQAPDNDKALVSGPGGALEIKAWNRTTLLDITLPDAIDVAFRLHSSKRPEFLLAFGGSISPSLRVETWDDELVLAVGDQFKAIRKIDDHEREVALRVCWDNNAQKASVYSGTGDLLTTWQMPDKLSHSQPGLILKNKGLNLSLDFLQIRAWNGKAPAKVDPKQPHVDLADGRSLSGEVSAGAPGFIKVLSSGQTAATDVALADVDALVFSVNAPPVTPAEATFSYADGTLVLGRIASINDGRASVLTSFTKDPLLAKLDQLRLLQINLPAHGGAAETPLASLDSIHLQDSTLHGKLDSTGDDGLHWTPVGGIKAVRPAKASITEITRVLPANAPPSSDQALFYLTSGDVLPGKGN